MSHGSLISPLEHKMCLWFVLVFGKRHMDHGHTGATSADRDRSYSSSSSWWVPPNTSAIHLALILKLQPGHAFSMPGHKPPWATPSGAQGWIPRVWGGKNTRRSLQGRNLPGAGLLWLLAASHIMSCVDRAPDAAGRGDGVKWGMPLTYHWHEWGLPKPVSSFQSYFLNPL